MVFGNDCPWVSHVRYGILPGQHLPSAWRISEFSLQKGFEDLYQSARVLTVVFDLLWNCTYIPVSKVVVGKFLIPVQCICELDIGCQKGGGSCRDVLLYG
jgi:hypothetical protein